METSSELTFRRTGKNISMILYDAWVAFKTGGKGKVRCSLQSNDLVWVSELSFSPLTIHGHCSVMFYLILSSAIALYLMFWVPLSISKSNCYKLIFVVKHLQYSDEIQQWFAYSSSNLPRHFENKYSSPQTLFQL